MAWSVVTALLGVIGTWVRMTRLARRQLPSGPMPYWFLGIAALLPVWLIAFVGLLGPSPVGRPELPLEVGFILSSSAALLGLILTDGIMRRLSESGRAHRPVTYWLLGVAAFLPAWGIALLGLLWTRS